MLLYSVIASLQDLFRVRQRAASPKSSVVFPLAKTCSARYEVKIGLNWNKVNTSTVGPSLSR